jgi:hypothetical protein
MSLFGTNTVASRRGWQNLWIDPLIPWSTPPQIITASDAAASDYFGYSVDMAGDGNYCIIGAPRDDTTTMTDHGAAYIFYKSGGVWTQQAKITASDRQGGDRFGTSVAINQTGDTVIVGAMLDTNTQTYQGSAYIFTRTGTTWTQQAKIVANNPFSDAYFGGAVSISADGNTVAVGAYGNAARSAYVFTRSGTTWTRQTTITTGTSFFGRAITLSADGNTMAVGAKGEVVTTTRVGTVSIYTRSAGVWTLQTKLLCPLGNYFGAYVSLSGDGQTLGVGSDDMTDSGNIPAPAGPWVYVGSGSNWSLQQSFGPDTTTQTAIPALNYDGTVLSISNNGSGSGTTGPLPTSEMYTRTGGIWTLLSTITYPQLTSTWLPNALDNSGDNLIIGVQDYDFNGIVDCGACYLYSK